MRRLSWILILLFSVIPGVVGAQEKTPAPVTLSLDASSMEAREALNKIGEKADVKVLADSTVSGKVTLKLEKKTVDEALTAVCEPLKLSWKVVYLGTGTVPQADNVSQLVRSLDALQASGLAVVDRTSQKASAMVKNTAVTPAYEKNLSSKASGYTPVYLVYNPKVPLSAKEHKDGGASWKTGDPMDAKQFGAVSKESMEALMKMSPDEQRAAVESSMNAQMDLMLNNPQIFQMFMREGMRMQMDILNQHPEFMRQIMRMSADAQVEMLRNMTPEMLQEIGRMQQEVIKSIPPEQLQRIIEMMKPGQAQ